MNRLLRISAQHHKFLSKKKIALIAAAFTLSSCNSFTEKLCTPSNNKKNEVAARSDKKTIMYTRMQYLKNPVEEREQKLAASENIIFLHQCWYKGTTILDIKTNEQLNAVATTQSSALEVEPLFDYYTSTAHLSRQLQLARNANPGQWEELGITKATISLSAITNAVSGLDQIRQSLLVGLFTLWFFEGRITKKIEAQEKSSEDLAAAKGTLERISPSEPPKKATQNEEISSSPVLQDDSVDFLDEKKIDFLAGKLKSWGMTIPPKEILRLEVKELAKYPCPPF